MPKTSQAALAVATQIRPLDRLAPPVELGEAEAGMFRQTVAAAPPDHFGPEDLVLLCAYCRAAVLERRAADQLAVAATVGNAPSPWLAVYSQAVKTLMALSVRLRIGPRSRAPSNNRRSARTGPAVSYYETMDLRETVMRKIDREALRRALRMATNGRRPPPESELEEWEDAALSAAYHCQMRALRLAPWQDPPMWADDDKPRDDFPGAGKVAAWELRRRLLKAGLSEFEPDPVAAIAAAPARQRVAVLVE